MDVWCVINNDNPGSRYSEVVAHAGPGGDAELPPWHANGHFLPGVSWEDIAKSGPTITPDVFFSKSPESFFARVRTSSGRVVNWSMLKTLNGGFSVSDLLLGEWGDKMYPWMIKMLEMDWNTLVYEGISVETIKRTEWPLDRWKSLFGVCAEFIQKMNFTEYDLLDLEWITLSPDEIQQLKLLKGQKQISATPENPSQPREGRATGSRDKEFVPKVPTNLSNIKL